MGGLWGSTPEILERVAARWKDAYSDTETVEYDCSETVNGTPTTKTCETEETTWNEPVNLAIQGIDKESLNSWRQHTLNSKIGMVGAYNSIFSAFDITRGIPSDLQFSEQTEDTTLLNSVIFGSSGSLLAAYEKIFEKMDQLPLLPTSVNSRRSVMKIFASCIALFVARGTHLSQNKTSNSDTKETLQERLFQIFNQNYGSNDTVVSALMGQSPQEFAAKVRFLYEKADTAINSNPLLESSLRNAFIELHNELIQVAERYDHLFSTEELKGDPVISTQFADAARNILATRDILAEASGVRSSLIVQNLTPALLAAGVLGGTAGIFELAHRNY